VETTGPVLEKLVFMKNDKNAKISFLETHDNSMDYHALKIEFPSKKPDRYVSVVKLKTIGELDINKSTYYANRF